MKIYLASIENQCIEPTRHLIDNAFYSYYYMRKKKSPPIVQAKSKHQFVFVDSGAHTFFSELAGKGQESASVHKKKTKTKETPDEYFENYLIWLKKYYDCLDYYAELDIGEIVGQEKVRQWRERLKKNNLYDKCVTVYHPDVMSWEDYIAMLEDSESKYIALEGDRSNRPRLPYNKLIKVAYEKGIKVHGFAMTKKSVMEGYPFYSVDSTSWNSASMYGCFPAFINGAITNIPFGKHLNKEKILKQIKDIDLDKLYSKDKKELREYQQQLGIFAYQKASKHYTKLWERRNIKWGS